MAVLMFAALSANGAAANDFTNDDLAQYGHNPAQFQDYMERGIRQEARDLYNDRNGSMRYIRGMDHSQITAFLFGYNCVKEAAQGNINSNGGPDRKYHVSPRAWFRIVSTAIDDAVDYCRGPNFRRLDRAARRVNPYIP